MVSSRISVIIPAFNAERTLADAVASVHRQATPIEIIIINDGSTDSTRACCDALGDVARCFHQENAGVAEARNAGLRAASGEFITFLDADDEWPDGSLDLLGIALDAHPEWFGVQGRTAGFISNEGPMAHAESFGAPWHGPTLASALFRREAFDRVGHFDPVLRVAEDLDWFIRARECGVTIGQVADVTLRYRLHSGSLTRGLDPVNKNLMVVLRRSIDRRRASASASAREVHT